MSGNTDKGQSGGVSISGGKVETGGGDIFGGNKTVNQNRSVELEKELLPLIQAIQLAPDGKRNEALSKLDDLKKEAEKGEKRDDNTIAKLVDGIVGLIPGAAAAVVSAFASPILGSIAGPVTKFVLGKLQGS